MPNYYYVKASGTATGTAGKFASLQTGAYTNATSYATLAAAATASTPTGGDVFLVADTDDVNTTTPFPSSISNCSVISCDVNNRDTYKAGAIYRTTAGADMTLSFANGTIYTDGLNIIINDDSNWASISHIAYHRNMTIVFQGSTSDSPQFAADNSYVTFEDCDIPVLTFSGSGLTLSGRATVEFINCTNSNAARAALITGSGSDKGVFIARDTDLTQFISTNGDIFGVNFTTTYFAEVYLTRCLLPSGLGVTSGTKTAGWWNVEITEGNTGDGYHYFYHENPLGQTEEDTTEFLNDTYDGTNNFSAQITATTLASRTRPYRYKLGILPASDIVTANQTVSVELIGDAGLTDSEVWIEVEHQDTTNQSLGIIASSQNAALLAAGTALTSSVAGWNVGTGTKYSIDLDLGSFTTQPTNTNLVVTICIGEPSASLNAALPTIADT